MGLESLFCYPRRLNSLPFINNIDQVNHLKNNIIIYNTLLARRDVKKYLNIAPAISLCSPLALNPDLPAQIRSIGLMDWMSKGLSNFTDLLDSDSVKSFEQIRADSSLYRISLEDRRDKHETVRAGKHYSSDKVS